MNFFLSTLLRESEKKKKKKKEKRTTPIIISLRGSGYGYILFFTIIHTGEYKFL